MESHRNREQRTVTRAQFARMKNWSRAYVTKLVSHGIIKLTAGGLVDVGQAERELAENRGGTMRSGKGANGQGRRSWMRARIDVEGWNAKLKRLEYERQVGKLLPANDVQRAAEKTFSNVRKRIRAIPRSLAATLASISDPAEIETLLQRAVDDSLDALSLDLGV